MGPADVSYALGDAVAVLLGEAAGMEVKDGARRLGGAVQDGTGLTPEQLGAWVAAAAMLAGLVVAVRAVDLLHRLWTPSGARR